MRLHRHFQINGLDNPNSALRTPQTAVYRNHAGLALVLAASSRGLSEKMSSRRRGIDVLVVDNKTLDANAVLLALARIAPRARALHLRSGDEALQFLFSCGAFSGHATRLPGLVLLSSEMPITSGLSVLDVMRAHPLTAAVPVVLLSTEHHPRGRSRCDRFAADAYVVKQWELESYCMVLARSIRRWLPRTLRGLPPPQYRAMRMIAST
jgi:CheY-like chemotaxis protein